MIEKAPSNNVAPEILAAQQEFPIGREVTVLRTVRDGEGNDTGAREPETGWTVDEARVFTRGDQSQVGVVVKGSKGELKVYRPERLRELNPPATEVADETVEQPYDEPLGHAMGGSAVVAASMDAAPRVTGEGLPPAPSIDRRAPVVAETAESLKDKLQKFLKKSEQHYRQSIAVLESNYANGVVRDELQRVSSELDTYIAGVGEVLHGVESRDSDYPAATTLVNAGGDIRYDISRISEGAQHKDGLGHILDVLRRSRTELEQHVK